jgi:predicted DNA-binding transcriptional regulator YafY
LNTGKWLPAGSSRCAKVTPTGLTSGARWTRPIARVLALLEILQAGGTRTVADLASRLDVDKRTVRRYVDHLIDLDVPVRSVRGRYGGYRLAPATGRPR